MSQIKSYINMSAKGRAFLKRRNVAAAVSEAIASQKNHISSEEGIVVKIDGSIFTVKSAVANSFETVEA